MQPDALTGLPQYSASDSGAPLFDQFVTIEAMKPAESKDSGAGLMINYSFVDSPFGRLIVAATNQGVCYLAFNDNKKCALHDLKQQFPHATYHNGLDNFQRDALTVLEKGRERINQIRLHLAGTPFQLKIWQSLLKIPPGRLSSYSEVARGIGQPGAARAVGSAIGRNPVALLIPCHRVVQHSGKLGGYKWGIERKSALIAWESAP